MRFLIILLMSCFGFSAATAYDIKMFGIDKYGFNQPKYLEDKAKITRKTLIIQAIADADNFPLSSSEQGSIFNKIFENSAERTGVKISLVYPSKDYALAIQNFERNKGDGINARFGVYFKEIPYSHNQYVYPAFFDNNVHVIFSTQNKPNIENKEQLKQYKGVCAATDKIAENVKREMNELGVKEVENLAKAFETLLTGEADYILASYYPSLLEAYKLGIKNYIVISKNPLWKMPLFIRVTPQIKRHKYMENFERYLRSSEYKNKRDKAFDELVEIYKENTRGIVPPTYIKSTEEKEVIQSENNDMKN